MVAKRKSTTGKLKDCLPIRKTPRLAEIFWPHFTSLLYKGKSQTCGNICTEVTFCLWHPMIQPDDLKNAPSLISCFMSWGIDHL